MGVLSDSIRVRIQEDPAVQAMLRDAYAEKIQQFNGQLTAMLSVPGPIMAPPPPRWPAPWNPATGSVIFVPPPRAPSPPPRRVPRPPSPPIAWEGFQSRTPWHAPVAQGGWPAWKVLAVVFGVMLGPLTLLLIWIYPIVQLVVAIISVIAIAALVIVRQRRDRRTLRARLLAEQARLLADADAQHEAWKRDDYQLATFGRFPPTPVE